MVYEYILYHSKWNMHNINRLIFERAIHSSFYRTRSCEYIDLVYQTHMYVLK